jgi:hypothetical protein
MQESTEQKSFFEIIGAPVEIDVDTSETSSYASSSDADDDKMEFDNE